jgi:hypothetical protein
MAHSTARKALVRRLAPVCALMLACTAATHAHHSAVAFDLSKTLTIKGTIRAFEWTNPHVWIWVDVPNSTGTVTSWGIESANLSMATRMGMNRKTFKPGDKVTMQINPRRDGMPSGSFRGVTFEDGRVFEIPAPASSSTGAAPANPGR